MRRVFAAMLLAWICWGCAPTTTGTPPPVSADPTQLRKGLATLPGAQVGEGNPPTLTYPGEVLFSKGAAVPLAGGTTLLDPLASLLSKERGVRWRATVRGSAEPGGGPSLPLAEKRAEMLKRFFLSRGVPPERVEFVAAEGDGPPLELVPLQPARDASSSRSNP